MENLSTEQKNILTSIANDIIKNKYKVTFEIETNYSANKHYVKEKLNHKCNYKKVLYATAILQLFCKLYGNIQSLKTDNISEYINLSNGINAILDSYEENIEPIELFDKHFQRKKIVFTSETMGAYFLNFKGYFLGGIFNRTLPEKCIDAFYVLIKYIATNHLPYSENTDFYNLLNLVIKNISDINFSFLTNENITLVKKKLIEIPRVFGMYISILDLEEFPKFMNNYLLQFK